MKLLALDTSTERMALAVIHGERQFTHEAEAGAAASATLIPAALDLLAQAGLTLAELDGVAVGQGPGAFTGLRTAVSVAQGLAFGAGRPVLPLDSLLIVAEDAWAQAQDTAGPAPAPGEPLWVVMDARMGEIYAAAYRRDPAAAGWLPADRAPGLFDPATLRALWQADPPRWMAGSALAAFEGLLPAGATGWAQPRSRAAALGRLAQAAWRAGAVCPPDQALPVYLRDKVALTTAEREAGMRQPGAGTPPAGA